MFASSRDFLSIFSQTVLLLSFLVTSRYFRFLDFSYKMNLTLEELSSPVLSTSTSPDVKMTQVLVWVAGIGILSHLGYFIRGEHHLEAQLLMRLSIILPLIFTIVQFRIGRLELQQAAWNSFLIVTTYCTALFTSMIIYRAFFHRLRDFPGPRMAKITKLWHVSKISNFDNYRQVDRLHAQYGDFVRTGIFQVYRHPHAQRNELHFQVPAS